MVASWVLQTAAAACLWIVFLLSPSASSFVSTSCDTRRPAITFATLQKNNDNLNNMNQLDVAVIPDAVKSSSSAYTVTSRRDWMHKSLTVAATSLVYLASTTMSLPPAQAAADDATTSPKILLLGGTGLVGSQIRQLLQEQGIPVIATSRNGRDGTVALDVTTRPNDVAKQVQDLAQGCTAVISTIGVVGTPDDSLVNAANALAAAGAKAAGVTRFVYITVSPQVNDLGKKIDFLQAYLQGKTFAREAVMHYYGDDDDSNTTTTKLLSYTLIEPTFIYGGDKFQFNPPRVNELYGGLIEGALSSAPLRLASSLAPGGFFKVALEPPVSAQAVAKAAIAGALGKTDTDAILDTYDKIVQAAAKLN
jgi:hypothetical protein